MKAYLPDYEMQVAPSLEGALEMLGSKDNWQIMAGGTDLMVLFDAGKLPEGKYLSINHLPELKGIKISDKEITFGPLTTYGEIRRNPILQREFPMLVEAANVVGAPAIQNRATIGGNIANASPAADGPPALLCYDAEIETTSLKRGPLWIPYYKFHTGYKEMLLGPNELITKIRIPRKGGEAQERYQKVGTRSAQAISKVCFAAKAEMEMRFIKDIRLAFGSVAPIPFRALKTEKVLRDQNITSYLISEALQVLKSEISPIDDIRSNKNYRMDVSLNLLESFLQKI